MKKFLLILSVLLVATLVAQRTDIGAENAIYGPQGGTGTGSATNNGSHIFRVPVAGASGTANQSYRTNFTLNRDGTLWLIPQASEPTIDQVTGNVWATTLYGHKLLIDSIWRAMDDRNPRRVVQMETECLGEMTTATGMTNADWVAAANAASVFTVTDTLHYGVFNLATGAITNGSGALRTSLAAFKLGGGAMTISGTARQVSALSDANDAYELWWGIADTSSTIPVNAVAFHYTHSASAGNWEAITRSAGTSTVTDTGVVYATTIWRSWRIEINAAGTSCAFYLDGTLVATNTTNIPTVALGYVMAIVKIGGAVGTNSRGFLPDTAKIRVELTTQR